MPPFDGFSLAPIKYENAIGESGPIREINLNKIEIDNKFYYESYAFLREGLGKGVSKKEIIYGHCDGTGTSEYKNLAIHKSISEAIERWACYCSHRTDAKLFGFDVEPSSTGIAAFPGLFKKSAREIALNEAIERWAIIAWWNEEITAKTNDNFIELETPFADHHVMINFKKYEKFYAYGFSCHRDMKSAKLKAKIEMHRNISVLKKYDTSEAPLELSERRLIHFSTEEGHSEFKAKLSKSLNITTLLSRPKVLIDTEIEGEWSKYATVWRVLLENKNQKHWSETENFFIF